ncbi:hypothetical protein Ndes2437A_g06593 [Nannochloris sp. 'desiccata']
MASTPGRSGADLLSQHQDSILNDSLQCAVCLSMCVRPCTTSCGHNFCRRCLRKSLAVDQHRRCPTCRHDLRATDLIVNRALWDVIQTLFPQAAATAPPETPIAEQQLLQQKKFVSTATAPSNRGRLGRSAIGSRSFVPPRPMAAAPIPPAATAAAADRTASAPRSAATPPAEGDHHEIDQLAGALGGLEIIDLTQEIDDELENSEPTAEVAPGGERSGQQPAAVAMPPSRPLQQQHRHALALARSRNWNTGGAEMPLGEVRPKRVVSGLFYQSAPSRQQQS